jgi:P-type E1-E2 ATPase
MNDGAVTRLHVAVDGAWVGAIDLDDPLRPGAPESLRQLAGHGIQLALLSGDAEQPVRRAAQAMGLNPRFAHFRQSPEQKATVVTAAQTKGNRVAFVGDGINDSIAIAAADLGIAVQSASAAAVRSADIVLHTGGFERVPEVLSLAKQVARRMRQTLLLAIGYNVVAIPFAVAGWVSPTLAAVLMVVSSLTVTMNAMRPFRPVPFSRSGQPSRNTVPTDL